MPDHTANLNLPLPLGNETVNRQFFIDLINAIDTGAVSETELEAAIGQIAITLTQDYNSTDTETAISGDAVRRGLETKQNTVRLGDNWLAAGVLVNAPPADNGGREYPNGFSFFKVSSSAGGWPTSNGYVVTMRAGSGGYQIFYEMYTGAVASDKTARQWTRSKRDSNGFWQDWARSMTEVDMAAHANDHIRHPLYAPNPTGSGTLYTVQTNPAEGITTIPDGFGLVLVPNVANTGAASVKIDTATTVPLKNIGGVDFAAGDLFAGQPYQFRKVNGNFIKSSGGGVYPGLEIPVDRLATPGAISGNFLALPSGSSSVDQGNGGVHVDSTRDRVFVLGYNSWSIYRHSTGALLFSGNTGNASRYSAYDYVNGWVFFDPTGSNSWPHRLNIMTGEVNVGFTVQGISGSVSYIVPTYDGGYIAYSSFYPGFFRYNSSGTQVWQAVNISGRALEYDKDSDSFWTIVNPDTTDVKITRYNASTRAVIDTAPFMNNVGQLAYRPTNIAYSKATSRLYVSVEGVGSSSSTTPYVWGFTATGSGYTWLNSIVYQRWGQVDNAGNLYTITVGTDGQQYVTKWNLNLGKLFSVYHSYISARSGPAVDRGSKFPGCPDFYVQAKNLATDTSPSRVVAFLQTLKIKA